MQFSILKKPAIMCVLMLSKSVRFENSHSLIAMFYTMKGRNGGIISEKGHSRSKDM